VKRTLILFCFLGLMVILPACASNSNNAVFQFDFSVAPIEGIYAPITASGYIEINSSRHSPTPPSAVFHPYPGYFHLFPFAALEGINIPVFSLTNSVDEIFELLEINREGVPEDRFGNQWLDNVTAVFDNFVIQYFIFVDRGSVFGELTGVADDTDADFWELVPADFILVTNGDRTIEPLELRVGDEFLGLRLTRIESSQVYMKNSEIYHQLFAEAEFSGQIELGGDVSIGLRFDSEYRVDAGFTVAPEYLSLLPVIADFGERGTLSVADPYALMSALNITLAELDTARNLKLTGVSAIFAVSWISSFGYVADFIELR